MSGAELHEQVPIEGHDFTADKGIAPLIRTLLDRGYRTVASCEDQDGGAWVGFETRAEAERVAAIVGGILIVPTAQERAEGAAINPDDPLLTFPDAAAVAFPSTQIQAATRAVVGGSDA